MTELLERTIARLNELPPGRQDEVATWLLSELEDESRWENAFAGSEPLLAALANAALEEHRAGKTQVLEPENL